MGPPPGTDSIEQASRVPSAVAGGSDTISSERKTRTLSTDTSELYQGKNFLTHSFIPNPQALLACSEIKKKQKF